MRREIKLPVVQALAAALLALRMLYDEQLLEKKMDAAGRISIKLTELALFMNTTFGIGLPSTKTDQKAMFMKLKKHGAIDVRIDDLGDEDAVIVIRAEILTLVMEQNVRVAQGAFEADRSEPAPLDAQMPEVAAVDNSENLGDDAVLGPKGAQIIPPDRNDRKSSAT